MNLGLPEKYAGDRGTIRAGLEANFSKSISGAGDPVAGAAGASGGPSSVGGALPTKSSGMS